MPVRREEMDGLQFLKDYGLGALRRKLVLLYALNLSDILLTFILLSSGGFRELNPLMAAAFQSGAITVLVKLVLPGAVLVWLYAALRRSGPGQKRACNRVINAIVIGYLAVNLMHLGWMAQGIGPVF